MCACPLVSHTGLAMSVDLNRGLYPCVHALSSVTLALQCQSTLTGDCIHVCMPSHQSHWPCNVSRLEQGTVSMCACPLVSHTGLALSVDLNRGLYPCVHALSSVTLALQCQSTLTGDFIHALSSVTLALQCQSTSTGDCFNICIRAFTCVHLLISYTGHVPCEGILLSVGGGVC